MWTRPWKFPEGFLIGGGLLVVGVLMQIVIGPVNWSLFAFPANVIALVLFLLLIGIMYALRNKVYAFGWMMHYYAAVPALAYALGLTVLMGLTVQTDEGGLPWLSQMLTFWPFVLIYVWMVLIAGLATLNRILHFKVKEIPFIINHLGVFLALTCATLGSADVQELQMTVYDDGQPEWRAVNENEEMVELDLAVELHKFTVEYYQDGTPRRFASDVSVYTKDGGNMSGTLEVNKPLKVNGWKIYQYGYDVARGPHSRYSVLMLVRDPWLPFVYAGIFLMLLGALCLMLFMAPKPVKS